MITSKDCFAKYGDPSANERRFMIVWDVPTALEIGMIPKKIYCNRAMVEPLTKAFNNIISRGLVKEIKTFDGCFSIRKKRGSSSMSLHSWGIAIDFNSSDNRFKASYEQLIKEGRHPFSNKFLQCFRDAGFDCGADWKTPDRMHMQLSKI